MSKVKVLRNDDAGALELDINNFIKDKKLVDIKISTDVIKTYEGIRIWTTAVIVYEDDDHNPLEHPESYVDDVMSMICDMTEAQITKLTNEITSYVTAPIEYRISRKQGKSE